MSICPHTHKQCVCQPSEGVMCEYGATPMTKNRLTARYREGEYGRAVECYDAEDVDPFIDELQAEIQRLTNKCAALTLIAYGTPESPKDPLRASEPKAPQWQPIESAPKQGYLMGAWKEGKWHAREMWWDDSVDEWVDTMSDRYLKPTHWARTPENRQAEPNGDGLCWIKGCQRKKGHRGDCSIDGEPNGDVECTESCTHTFHSTDKPYVIECIHCGTRRRSTLNRGGDGNG